MERTAIVCCIESGPLEAQTVRLAESVRSFGGSLSSAPIVAARLRWGPPLTSVTRRSLDRLGVELVEKVTNTEFAWEYCSSKVLALLVAEEVVRARQYIWMDSDVLVLADPEALWLAPHEDFTACVPDSGALGSRGPSDRHDDMWRRACDILGIEIDSLPWVTTFTEGMHIRFYLNGGIFAYRGGIGFAQARCEDYFRYLRSKVTKSHPEVHFSEQVMLGLTVHRLGLRWRLLSHSYNYGCHSKLLNWLDMREIAAARVLHYHDMLMPEHWTVFSELLMRSEHPLRDELIRWGPLRDVRGIGSKSIQNSLHFIRAVKRRLYYRSCGFRLEH